MARFGIGRSTLVVGVLIAINLAELTSMVVFRERAQFYNFFRKFPAIRGYGSDGTFTARRTTSSCTLVRLFSENCPYCRKDNVRYLRLVRRAASAGCTNVAMTPAPEEGALTAGQSSLLNGAPGISRIGYIDMQLGKSMLPFYTPETILVSRNGFVLWSRIGELDVASMNDANNAIERTKWWNP